MMIASIFDIIWGKRKLKKLDFTAASSVMLKKDLENNIEFIITNNSDEFKETKIKLLAPEELCIKESIIFTNIPKGKSSFTYTATPTKRGDFTLTSIIVELPTPLKLWKLKKTFSINLSCKVYPNLNKEKSDFVKLLATIKNGSVLQRFTGQGREFDELREYVNGDPFNIISWKATAKKGRPITKKFKIESTQDIYTIIDTSRLSKQLVDDVSVLENYIKTSLILGQLVQSQADAYGVVSFDTNVNTFVKANIGKEHYNLCRESIYKLQPEDYNQDFGNLFSFISLHIRKRALLVFLTDITELIDNENFLRNIKILSRKHLCLIFSIVNKHSEPFFSGDQPITEDMLSDKLASHINWENIVITKQKLYNIGVNFKVISADKLNSALLNEYIQIKKRQIL
jgi:uncharacterized protein (DUF58 family)